MTITLLLLIVVDVIKAVSEISRDFNSWHPIGKYREIRIPRVFQAIGETNAGNEIINQIYVASRYRSSSKLNQTRMMTFANHQKSFSKLCFINRTFTFPLKDDHVIAADDTPPRRRRRRRRVFW
ncbi:hypothetical protein R6Q59_001710 [Mikania micrantha]